MDRQSRKKPKRQYDFIKMIKWIGIVLVLFVIANISVSYFLFINLSNETSKLADNIVSSYTLEIERKLENITMTMKTMLMYNNDLMILQNYVPLEDEVAVFKQQKELLQIKQGIKNLLVSNSHQERFFSNYGVYMEEQDYYIDGSNFGEEYNESRKIKEDLINIIVNDLAKGQDFNARSWNIVDIQGEGYIINYYRMDQRYIYSWINVDDLLKTMPVDALGEQSFFVFSNKEGLPWNQQVTLENKNVVIPAYEEYRMTKKNPFSDHIIIGEKVPNTSFYLNAIVEKSSVMGNIVKIQVVLIIVLVLFSSIALIIILYIRKTILQPIETFSRNIEGIKNNEDYTVETYYQIAELKNASETLAKMADQISQFKIDIYEQALEQQNIKLDFLSLQIEPHFYLNCLNVIYNMVQIGKYEEIQNLTQCVSDYLRYVFKSRNSLVCFGEELCHIERYLEIQKIRYPQGFEACLDIADDVKQVEVPPLLIYTFIENALKHTINWEEDIKVNLRAQKISINGYSYMEVLIEDSGDGFDEEILSKLQNNIDITEGEKRIGIMNAIKRLHLQYKQLGIISFENRVTGGASVKILIPIERQAIT